MEGDPTKLQDPNKAINDPKYSFLQLANSGRYNYNQLGDMLKELQGGAAGSLWQGWTANGDKLSYTGDPSKLADVWGGVDSVDAIGGFGNFGKGEVGGWRWGADSPASRAADPAGLDALLASLGTQQPSTLDLSGLLASLMQSWKTPTAPVAAPPSYAPAPNEPEDPQGFFQSADPAEMPLFDGQNESVNQALQMMAMGLPMAANQPAGMTLDDQIRRLLMGAN